MKTDKLEQFITKQKEDFDDLVPDAGLWTKIEADVKPPRQILWRSIMWKAAAVVLIFTASYFFHDFVNINPANNKIARQSDNTNMEEVQTFIEAEVYYTSMIGNKRKEVFHLAGENRTIGRELDVEFEELDQVLNELKGDLSDNASNEEVLEAMIQNFRLKLLILDEILLQLKASNKTLDDDNNNKYEI
jgi:hypothetical protein